MTDSARRFINRELSWLEFNQRVLDEARNAGTPLLERLKFLAITGSNLDEFFMVRAGGLQILVDEAVTKLDPSGLSPGEQLAEIATRSREIVVEQYRCLSSELEPALAEAGVKRVRPDGLTEAQKTFLQRRFDSETSAIVTPMAVDLESGFPLLENLTLHLLVWLIRDGQNSYAVIPLGRVPSRLVPVPSSGGHEFILVEDMIRIFLGSLFPGEEVAECTPFRITRNAGIELQEDLAFDLLEAMEDILDGRKTSHCVRLEIEGPISDAARAFLIEALRAREPFVHENPGPLDLSAFMVLLSLAGFEELKIDSWPPIPSPLVDPATPLFETISSGDVLLHHPFESFDPVVRLVEEAAEDDDVLAIKQVLYRTAKNSRIVAALKRAATNGKYVTVVVELRARFDEARNIDWARDLEKSGVQVIYGVRGLKIHAKVCVIVRREPEGIRRYVHYGTGNYNESTARLYTDVGILTSDEDLGGDATTFFNTVSGYSQLDRFRKIHVAPAGLREKLTQMIRAEIDQVRHGQEGQIIVKTNSLSDPELIEALYAASCAGVDVHLIVRGICCLRPGIEGQSERIRVVSIVDRFLEHSRIFYFRHGGDDLVFIASADWMTRNLDRRVELLVPVEDRPSRDRLLEVLLECLRDDVKGRWLQPDGRYARSTAVDGVRSQEALYRRAKKAAERAREVRITTLEPHRSPKFGT